MPRCAVCGQDNPGGFRFCGACGASLAGPARAPAEERRLVSVLFCDLVGFTARSDQADPEDVGALLRPYHARLRAEIERRGGTLDKFIGDGVMAVFGAPVAHEDDPERAVRCALGMLGAIEELNEARPSLDLAIRVGITTGEALVRLGPGQQTEGVVGDVVNTASRLEGVAPAGGVVVGEATFRATRRLFDYQELAPVKVKGKADPVPVWRLEGARSRIGIEAFRRAGTPFVGRQAELDLLKGLFEQTLTDRTVRLVTVVGEPGVGKSRFVSELAASVDERPELVIWRQGRCLPYGDGITFWALGEIVKAQAGVLESDPPAEVTAKLEAAVADLLPDPSERGWLRARLAPLLGVAGPDAVKAERAELFAAWRRFVEAIAAARPLVLVVEDLHWADQAMLEFLEHLVERSADLPLLLVATARPELLERQPGWGGGSLASTRIPLGALTDLETARLLAALVGRSVLPVGVQALLLERAAGNPLYAEEFARLLADHGLAAGNQVEGEVAAVPDIPVPETVHGLIAARLDALTPEVRALVQDAAVIGRVFWPGAVAAMDGTGTGTGPGGAGDDDGGAVQAGLAELERKQLVQRAQTSSVQHQDEYVFWHALVRDVAYAQIPRVGRARRHQAVAEWVEAVAGERVGDLAEVVAHHYGQALAYARAAREPQARIDQLVEPTRRFLILAGDRTINLDLDRARAYYRQAVELGQPRDPARPHLLVRTGRVAFQSGDYPEAVAVYEEAIADMRRTGDLQGLGATLGRLATVLWNQGDTRGANAALTEAIELLEREPPGPELVSAYVRMAGDRVTSGHAGEALDWANKGLALADDLGGLPRVRPRALDARGMARCDLGDFDGGMADLREGLALGLELGSGYDTAVLYNNLAEPVWLVEGPAAAMAVCEEGVDFAERRGLSEAAMWLRSSTLGPLLDQGRWEEVVTLADEAIAWDLAHGGDYLAIGCRRHVTLVLAWQGDLIAARDLAGRVLPRAREIDDLQQLVPALVNSALVERASGDQPAALALVEEAAELTAGRAGGRRYLGQYLADMVRVAAVPAPALAKSLLDDAEATATRYRLAAATSQAVLAESIGELEHAATLYTEVAAGWSAYGQVLEHVLALLGQGRCLAQLGRPDAGPVLRVAHQRLIALGARPTATEANDLLDRLAAGPRP
jgi:class 3 adenylate cyclase/tetratricopeptide (TPR) repeat protein